MIVKLASFGIAVMLAIAVGQSAHPAVQRWMAGYLRNVVQSPLAIGTSDTAPIDMVFGAAGTVVVMPGVATSTSMGPPMNCYASGESSFVIVASENNLTGKPCPGFAQPDTYCKDGVTYDATTGKRK